MLKAEPCGWEVRRPHSALMKRCSILYSSMYCRILAFSFAVFIYQLEHKSWTTRFCQDSIVSTLKLRATLRRAADKYFRQSILAVGWAFHISMAIVNSTW